MARQTSAGWWLCGLLAVVLCGCGDDATTLPQTPAWHEFAGNPVLVGGTPDAWDWDADGVSSPSVLSVAADSLLMWYTGHIGNTRRIGLATSRDGLTWRKHAANPVLDIDITSTWEALAVAHPNVRFDGDTFTMYFDGTGASESGIGIATSADGVHWTRATANPVFAPGPAGTWDESRVSMPWVRVEGGEHHMWYTGRGDYVAIGYATSDDGRTWMRLASPVLHPQVLEALTFAPCVLAGDGPYRIWYGAIHETTGGRGLPAAIDYAQSFDGVQWTGQRTVLGPGATGAWDARALMGGCVLQDDAQLRMWFTGERTVAVGDTTVIVSAIGLATFD